MPEMLTVKQTVEKIKKTYPETNIKECTLRAWLREGKFHYVQAGKKALISWASLVSFLTGEGA